MSASGPTQSDSADAAAINAIQVLQTSALHTLLTGMFDSTVVIGAAFCTQSADTGMVAGTTFVCMLPLAIIINKDGVIEDPGAIMSGMKVEVYDLLVPDNINPTGIKAAYIIVE